MNSQLSDYVSISPIGKKAIAIFDKIRIDGEKTFNDNTMISCYSHIHNDHMHGFEDSLGEIGTKIFTTSLTRKMLLQAKPSLKIKSSFKGLDNRKVEKIDGFEFSFLRSNHILGSGQILVRGPEGSVLYSSDFMLKGTDTDVSDIDVLVLDANHGSPDISQVFENKKTSKQKLEDYIKKIVKQQQESLIIRAHVGTLQEIILWCDEICQKNIKFFCGDKEQVAFAEVYAEEKEINLREIQVNDFEVSRLLSLEIPMIRFLAGFTGNITECEQIEPMIPSIHFSGTRVSYDSTSNLSRMASINLQEHASHLELLNYVELINPKKGIVVDNSPTRTQTEKNSIDLTNTLVKKYSNLIVEYQPIKRPGG